MLRPTAITGRKPNRRLALFESLTASAKSTRCRKVKSPAGAAGPLLVLTSLAYRPTRSLLSAVPIELKVVTIWVEEVSMKNLFGLLAQFCSTVAVGSGGELVST